MEKNNCKFNGGLICPVHDWSCPLQDPLFTRDLERFLFTGRTAQSPGFESKIDISVQINKTAEVIRAAKIKIFSEEDLLNDYVKSGTGKIQITARKCRKWRSMYRAWLNLQKIIGR